MMMEGLHRKVHLSNSIAIVRMTPQHETSQSYVLTCMGAASHACVQFAVADKVLSAEVVLETPKVSKSTCAMS